ncbi:MAG: peptidoglycan-binding protein, partial [Thermoleophilaceae bacterium]|nr:peptidoglycan-binding protein [Thermoleophilaceae bacterium]
MSHARRDLSCHEPWAESLERSLARREAAASHHELSVPSRRAATLAAAVVVAGGSTAGLTGTLPGSVEAASAAKVRHRGSGVAEMQRALGLPADGVFGPATERALRRWQRKRGL